ncbi:titin isoform X2 [Uranotaenia lowii]|uniref:titin isoform X2 n=1 Tax=Uranotaenia lowii TaxID=190385 RepID=UPI00247ABDE7|nr:titin isoform X2 [Uranotaenia lowii]XP_055612916.1 titin isoform X2 [Uranotaenia lowii]
MDDDGSEYSDGEIVWVKLSYCWWPGEVFGGERLTEEFTSTLKRQPLAVVKFFDEDSYEYVKNTNFIYKYNCSRKHEFLRKGLEQYRAKNRHMEKFPSDVMHAERATGGDPDIVNSTTLLQPQKRESYAHIFQPTSSGKGGKGKITSPSKIVPAIPTKKHEVRILAQASSLTGIPAHGGGSVADNSSTSSAQIYHCYKCGFESRRQNVIVVHTKYCRAVPSVTLTVPKSKETKTSDLSPAKLNSDIQKPQELPKPIEVVKESVDESIEELQVKESKPSRGKTASRTPRTAAIAKSLVETPTSTIKSNDRRRNRGRGKASLAADEITESLENQQEVKEVSVKESEKPEQPLTEDSPGKTSTKADVELKNELLADWSEDEQDEPESSTVPETTKQTNSTKKSIEENNTSTLVETATSDDAGKLEKDVEKVSESSPQISSPVSSGTIIKYRNIPKKQKREFIEVTNDQPSTASVIPVANVEKSSSEGSISTGATCGESLSVATLDKTPTSNDSLSERPLSAKQRILDRATRGSSSKSVSSDELKPESPTKLPKQESPSSTNESRKEVSCFDFKDDEDDEVVLNKSPRRSLSNKRDTSADVSKDEEDLTRAKQDADLKNEIDSLLNEVSIPKIPDLPKRGNVKSPVPTTSSSTETTPQQLSNEEIDDNRTLPPKERGKRIFKTRNKIIENEAIALEQSKAIVMDFVLKSHEEEIAELRAAEEAKQMSESPTTTNDDSQESVASAGRFEKSEFAAIKSKRSKYPQQKKSDDTVEPEEPAVSSSVKSNTTEISCPVSIDKEEIESEALSTPVVSGTKGRRGKQRKSGTPVVEKVIPQEVVEPVIVQQVEESTPRARKKRSSEFGNLDLSLLVDTPRSRRGRKPDDSIPEPELNQKVGQEEQQDKLLKVIESKNKRQDKSIKQKASRTVEINESSEKNEELPSSEEVKHATLEPKAPVMIDVHRKSKRSKKDDSINQEQEKSESLTEQCLVVKLEDINVLADADRDSKSIVQEDHILKVGETDKDTTQFAEHPAEEEPISSEAVETPHRKSKRSKKDDLIADKSIEKVPEKPEPLKKGESVAANVENPPETIDNSEVLEVLDSETHRKSKRTRKDEPVAIIEHKVEVLPSPEENVSHETKSPKTKRGKHVLKQITDSPRNEKPDTKPEPIADEASPINEKSPKGKPIVAIPDDESSASKQQPIKMIIKSRGNKSNSELIFDPVIVSPERKEEISVKESLPKSPKSTKRKKPSFEEMLTQPDELSLAVMSARIDKSSKASKLKRTKLDKQTEQHSSTEVGEKNSISATKPSVTDLQIAEALIKLPEVVPSKTKAIKANQEEAVSLTASVTSSVANSASSSSGKTINPRKRHLQTLVSAETTEGLIERNKCNEIIPEKKKRDVCKADDKKTTSLPEVAPAKISEPTKISNDEDKFDIDNIPIVLDDSGDLLDDSRISTTTSSVTLQNPVKMDEDVQLISTTRPMAKKLVIVKNSNGSAKIIGTKESFSQSNTSKKSLGIKSSTIIIKPPNDEPKKRETVRSPVHSPQLVQASSGGQIVITSKGTVLTTQSPSTSTAKMTPKTQMTQNSSVISSVSSVGTISSSTTAKKLTTHGVVQRSSSPAKSPAKICVQSQQIIHPPIKSKMAVSKPSDPTAPVVVHKMELTPKKSQLATPPPKKALAKKMTELSQGTSSSNKPLFTTSKGEPTTLSPKSGKKGHKVIKISPQKLKEFTRLGMVEDKGQGKVLTASGMKKFRQEQQLLQQQHNLKVKSEQTKTSSRSYEEPDEEPSTSTPTPPPPAGPSTEVVIAAAADSSVKEVPGIYSETEEVPETTLASSTQLPSKPSTVTPTSSSGDLLSTEGNEADAAIQEIEPETSTSQSPTIELADPIIAEPSDESELHQPTLSTEPAESAESSSNVQESSQLIAVPAENFGGPANLFYLCSVRDEGFVPVNNELLYLDASNQLVALPENASLEEIASQQAAAAGVLEIPVDATGNASEHHVAEIDGSLDAGQQNIILNTQDGQQIILDQQSLMALAAGGDTSQLLTPDGQQILLQGSAQELLAALAVSQPGLGIVADGAQIIVAPESLIDLQDTPLPGEIIQVNPNTTVETNAVLTKPPIMSTVEVPTKNGNGTESSSHPPEQNLLEGGSATNLDESLAAVIGVPTGNPNVPTSLELPITVTNPVIAKTTTSKINPIYPSTTAISAIGGIDPALAAAAVIELPTVAQTVPDKLSAIKSVWD